MTLFVLLTSLVRGKGDKALSVFYRQQVTEQREES